MKSEIEIDPEIQDLVPRFISSRKSEAAVLKELVEKGAFDEIARMAHTWKGVARPYGFPTLETLATELESAAKLHSLPATRNISQSIRSYLDQYADQITE